MNKLILFAFLIVKKIQVKIMDKSMIKLLILVLLLGGGVFCLLKWSENAVIKFYMEREFIPCNKEKFKKYCSWEKCYTETYREYGCDETNNPESCFDYYPYQNYAVWEDFFVYIKQCDSLYEKNNNEKLPQFNWQLAYMDRMINCSEGHPKCVRKTIICPIGINMSNCPVESIYIRNYTNTPCVTFLGGVPECAEIVYGYACNEYECSNDTQGFYILKMLENETIEDFEYVIITEDTDISEWMVSNFEDKR
jgi:hypothetical protein